MPRKESSAMDERLRFGARLLDGEAMTDSRREFGISRKAGYKIFGRYREQGSWALMRAESLDCVLYALTARHLLILNLDRREAELSTTKMLAPSMPIVIKSKWFNRR